ncbi:MAG TPA: outer membrane beta-barrel protein [Vicinamibacterales bacterium]|jgi:outer membrane protein W
MAIKSWVRVAGISLMGAALGVFAPRPAFAQVTAEVGVDFGWTSSEGINASTPVFVPPLNATYQSLDITRGAAFGLDFGVYFTENWEAEFIWHRQFSSLEISNPAAPLKIANQNVDNYHGNLVYNFFTHDDKLRPFIFGGLGATVYVPGDFDSGLAGSAGQQKIGSFGKFSTTWGGGIKYYPNPKIGVKATIRWTPTYIKTDAAGIWCDPFYFPSCWVVGNADYQNSIEYTGGVTFRFGKD